MAKEYSNKNLQNTSFKNEDLSHAIFSNSDLRGADFSDTNLTGASFTHVRTGITPLNTTLIFIVALIVSLISGYFAMLAGHSIHELLASKDQNARIVGYVTIVVTIFFILYAWRKGTGRAIRNLIIPFALFAAVAGLIYTGLRLGTGFAIVYQLIALFFVVAMIVVGTIARATAKSLSVVLFLIVALSGGMFGKSIGGGVGSVIMALACAQISKRALSDAKGFDRLRRIAFYVTKKLGTSFRNTVLAETNFSKSKLRNADFTNADLTLVRWGDSKKINCLINEQIVNEKASPHSDHKD